MELEAESAIFWSESRKELSAKVVECSWDCREELSVIRESNKEKDPCNARK